MAKLIVTYDLDYMGVLQCDCGASCDANVMEDKIVCENCGKEFEFEPMHVDEVYVEDFDLYEYEEEQE